MAGYERILTVGITRLDMRRLHARSNVSPLRKGVSQVGLLAGKSGPATTPTQSLLRLKTERSAL